LLPTTITIDGAPKCVVRPNDTKALTRFIRNAKSFLLSDNEEGAIAHRAADEREMQIWRDALALHKAWGGDEEGFFGVPLQ
jgi:hypothetical protein